MLKVYSLTVYGSAVSQHENIKHDMSALQHRGSVTHRIWHDSVTQNAQSASLNDDTKRLIEAMLQYAIFHKTWGFSEDLSKSREKNKHSLRKSTYRYGSCLLCNIFTSSIECIKLLIFQVLV